MWEFSDFFIQSLIKRDFYFDDIKNGKKGLEIGVVSSKFRKRENRL